VLYLWTNFSSVIAIFVSDHKYVSEMQYSDVCLLVCLQAGSDLYAFVEFAQHSDAQLALMAMNKRIVLGRVTK